MRVMPPSKTKQQPHMSASERNMSDMLDIEVHSGTMIMEDDHRVRDAPIRDVLLCYSRFHCLAALICSIWSNLCCHRQKDLAHSSLGRILSKSLGPRLLTPSTGLNSSSCCTSFRTRPRRIFGDYGRDFSLRVLLDSLCNMGARLALTLCCQ